MSYKLPDKAFHVNPAGSIPTITYGTNQNPSHCHVQVQTAAGWVMVVDRDGSAAGTPIQIQGGPINSAADFVGKTFVFDVTVSDQTGTSPVESTLQVAIAQDGNNLLQTDDDHYFTGMEQYYEYLNAQ